MKTDLNINDILGTVINGDSVEVMKTLPESSIDLVVTSPKYNVGIDYDSCDDTMSMEDYWVWTEKWLTEVYRLLKDDGRAAINIPIEINAKDRGGRILFLSEFWMVMKKVGYKFFGVIDLNEQSPHRSKTTAWGSWMSPSQPYIYNPKECVVLAYKKTPKKITKGIPEWESTEITTKDLFGEETSKKVYSEAQKKEFMSLVYGQWDYFADTKQMTKATFSMDIPSKAIKILTYKNEVVLDPFAGSGTSLCAAEVLNRRWVGIELSPNYTEVAKQRVQHFVDMKSQLQIDL